MQRGTSRQKVYFVTQKTITPLRNLVGKRLNLEDAHCIMFASDKLWNTVLYKTKTIWSGSKQDMFYQVIMKDIIANSVSDILWKWGTHLYTIKDRKTVKTADGNTDRHYFLLIVFFCFYLWSFSYMDYRCEIKWIDWLEHAERLYGRWGSQPHMKELIDWRLGAAGR